MARTPTAIIHGRRILELDGLRSFAILLVLYFHLFKGPLANLGWIGVDLFFVLSGFLITSILVESKGRPHWYRQFMIRRALRILPLYYLCLIGFTAKIFLSHGEHGAWVAFMKWGGPWPFVAYLGNVWTSFRGVWPPVWIFVPLWSLQVEEQFYLFYPWVVAGCSAKTLRRTLWACFFLALGLRCLIVSTGRLSPLACYTLTPLRMDALAIGGLVAVYRKDGVLARWRAVAIPTALTAGICLCLLAVTKPEYVIEFSPMMQSVGYSLTAAMFAATLALLLLNPGSRVAGWLRWRPLTYTGQIAYGLYMLHPVCGELTVSFLRRVAPVVLTHRWGVSLLSLATAFIAASVSWRFFESKLLLLRAR